MKKTEQQTIAIACIFTWIGFVSAISFMEAWLKFRAPGLSLSVGLGIGKLVFAALNKTEWVFAIVTSASAVLYGRPLSAAPTLSLGLAVLILILQTVWLLPALDQRAQQYINGHSMRSAPLHLWFVAAEILKVICLLRTGVLLFKRT